MLEWYKNFINILIKSIQNAKEYGCFLLCVIHYRIDVHFFYSSENLAYGQVNYCNPNLSEDENTYNYDCFMESNTHLNIPLSSEIPNSNSINYYTEPPSNGGKITPRI